MACSVLAICMFTVPVVLASTTIAASALLHEDPRCMDAEAATVTESEACVSTGALNLLQTRMTLARANTHRTRRRPAVESLVVDTNNTNGLKSSPAMTEVTFPDRPHDDWLNVHVVPPLRPKPNTEHNIIRTVWQKTLRCDGPSGDNCEECIGNIDCFGDCPITATEWYWREQQHGKCVYPSSGGRWTRFLFTFHVKCPVDMWVTLRAAQVNGGTMALLWDDTPLHSFDEKSRNPLAQLNLKSTEEEGHSISVEFTKSSTASWNYAHFRTLVLSVTRQFSICLDSKACFEELEQFGEPGLRLKNSNRFLLQCLSNYWYNTDLPADLHQPCLGWYRCLWRTGSFQGSHLYRLLVAAGTRGSAVLATTRSRRTSFNSTSNGKKAEHKCLYPPNEDPMSWDCDCYEQMRKRCEQIGAHRSWLNLCIRAEFCLYPRTCERWKTASCQTPQIRHMMIKLQSLANFGQKGARRLLTTQQLLTARSARQESSEEIKTEFDRSLGAKRCD
eukprot:gnl/TRDRNA2_/TRDRNA2_155120_c1_seq1.p1 gnl/TRDRNA2_/TRDRNA2_155120_c1~~gnl/TRDRNA2_/TRDRNA2_155120_c1_seq1.p1  ORF type:complete len:515 (+),score=32.82 gnl/TRDRNA2_/TRDRNA2_155120_c1_seq1:41-1546(+)